MGTFYKRAGSLQAIYMLERGDVLTIDISDIFSEYVTGTLFDIAVREASPPSSDLLVSISK